MTKDAYYFPHFSNARHDRKIMRLRKELGVEGYGIFFMLLEVLRDQVDYKYPTTDIDLLAEEFGCSEQKIRVVICNYQLFVTDEEKLFFSPKLFLYLQPYLNMKEQRRLAGIESGKARQLKLEAKNEQPLNNRSSPVEQPLNENEQSKVKESKVLKDSLPKKHSAKNKIVSDYFCQAYLKTYNTKYKFNGAKDGANLSQMLGVFAEPEAIELIDLYFEYEDDYIQKNGRSISALCSQLTLSKLSAYKQKISLRKPNIIEFTGAKE